MGVNNLLNRLNWIRSKKECTLSESVADSIILQSMDCMTENYKWGLALFRQAADHVMLNPL